jgi:hypothetical protein
LASLEVLEYSASHPRHLTNYGAYHWSALVVYNRRFYSPSEFLLPHSFPQWIKDTLQGEADLKMIGAVMAGPVARLVSVYAY